MCNHCRAQSMTLLAAAMAGHALMLDKHPEAGTRDRDLCTEFAVLISLITPITGDDATEADQDAAAQDAGEKVIRRLHPISTHGLRMLAGYADHMALTMRQVERLAAIELEFRADSGDPDCQDFASTPTPDTIIPLGRPGGSPEYPH